MAFVSDPSFTKARIVLLGYDGVRFVDRSETPLVNGAITAMALLHQDGSNSLLVARNYPSLFSSGASELILLNRSNN